jgi:hypothetical protein
MPCSFGLLAHPRSEPGAQAQRPPWIDRECPLGTARARCLWYAGGTAGENDDARTWRQQFQLDPRVRPVSGDYSVVGKAGGPRQAWVMSVELPYPGRLGSSLSSGDRRNRRLSCAAALLPLARPIGALGRSLAGES